MGWILQVGWGNFLCVSCLPWNLRQTRWWFEILFIFNPTCGRFPIWLIFFKGVETTNLDILCGEKTPPTRSDFWFLQKGICQTGWHKRVAAILRLFWFQFTSIEKINEWISTWGGEIHTRWKMNWAVLIVMCKWASQGGGVEHQPVHMEPENAPGFLEKTSIYIWVVATQIFFMFTPTWGKFPMWLIFFGWVGSTTNQIYSRKVLSKPWMSSRPNKEWYFLDDPCKRFLKYRGAKFGCSLDFLGKIPLGGGFMFFCFHSDPVGKWSKLTTVIFFRWAVKNHQLDYLPTVSETWPHEQREIAWKSFPSHVILSNCMF